MSSAAVIPPSPSIEKTLTFLALLNFNASAAPAAKGDPWPVGPVLALKKRVFPCISGCPGNPPFCLKFNKSSQVN